MTANHRPFAIVTGASSGIGYELARCCASNGFDMLIASPDPQVEDTANRLRALGAQVEAMLIDLENGAAVERLVRAVAGRDVGALLANARDVPRSSRGEHDIVDFRRGIDVGITGTVDLVQRISGLMRTSGSGHILVVAVGGDCAPNDWQPVALGSQAFLESYCLALRDALESSGVTVTCVVPHAVVDKVGSHSWDDPARAARSGFLGMMAGKALVNVRLDRCSC